MGAINSAFNQAAGSLAAAAYGIEQIKEAQLSEGEKAKTELSDLGKEIPSMKAQLEEEGKKVAASQKDAEILGELLPSVKTPEDEKAFGELADEIMNDQLAAQRAMISLKYKVAAKEDMMRRTKQAIERSNRWKKAGGIL